MLLTALLVSIRATILFTVCGFQENFVHLIICSCLGPMVSKSERNSPMLSLPPAGPPPIPSSVLSERHV